MSECGPKYSTALEAGAILYRYRSARLCLPSMNEVPCTFIWCSSTTTYTTSFSSLHHLSCSALLSSFSSLIYTLLLLDTPKLYASACPSSPTHPLALSFALTDRLLTNPFILRNFFFLPQRAQSICGKEALLVTAFVTAILGFLCCQPPSFLRF